MLTRVLRGATSLLLFALFGLGGLVISPLMAVLRRPERAQPVVRAVWRVLLKLFIWSGLIDVRLEAIPDLRGTVIVVNHPSLIDAVILTSLLPRTLYVAKHALKANPWMSLIVRATSLPDDERLPGAAQTYLEKGWNVLLFPEGTRTPPSNALNRFRRGAAHVALRARVPILCLGLHLSRRILGKTQPAWEMGEKRVIYTLKKGTLLRPEIRPGESFRAAAMRITDVLQHEVEELRKDPAHA